MDGVVDYSGMWKVGGKMKSFYSSAADQAVAPVCEAPIAAVSSSRARVAIYDGPGSAPRVEEIATRGVREYIEALASRVYEIVRERGGDFPYTVIREITENLIHADFAEPVVTILDDGATLRFADQGPGIVDKARAVLPGFTTADHDMKRYVRGVGSGLPIVKDYLSYSGGNLVIEDNLGRGAVVTLRSGKSSRSAGLADTSVYPEPAATPADPTLIALESPVHTAYPLPLDESLLATAAPRLSTRQKQVLALVMESGSAGPSLVSKELGVAISTAYRDLASLEELGLISAESGKRQLTQEGLAYLKDMTSGY